MPKVSIIMGVYNCAKTLRASIDSILAQTFTDWEFVICDDGSEDNTFAILQEYKECYPEKFLILKNEKNRGLTKTLNICIDHSSVSADYIARMDGDDISLPKRLEKQIAFLNEHEEIAFLGCNVNLFDENGRWGKRTLPERPNRKDFLWTSPFVHPTVLMRKQAIDIVNGYRDCPQTNRCEDYDLWMRMYAVGLIGYNLQEELFDYFEGRDSYRKRKYRYRFNEANTRFYGYKRLGLLPQGIFHVVKPLLIGLIPATMMMAIRKSR